MPESESSSPIPHLVAELQSNRPFVAAELRPPRAELEARAGMDAWIDTYHSVRRLTRDGRFVFLTDNAVGAREEDNLRHLVTNVGADVPRELVVPFLTAKHSREYCMAYPERARQHGFQALVVLGGDRHDNVPRCVEHAWELRRDIRAHGSSLALGGWANPHADASDQARFLADPSFTAEFYLTQIVSHHDIGQVGRLVEELDRRGVTLPGVFGVFYYRSAKPATLGRLADFITVPVAGLTREFDEGVPAEEVCARTLRALSALGVRRFYVSNLPLSRAADTLHAVLECAGLKA